MLILETAAVAFSMFSALPVPQPVWNQRNMRYAMCAFPLVGLVLGRCGGAGRLFAAAWPCRSCCGARDCACCRWR